MENQTTLITKGQATYVKTFKVFTNFEHELFGAFRTLWQGDFWRVGLG